MTDKTLISAQNGVTLNYVVGNKEIDQIKVFKDGKVLFESRSGRLEAFEGRVTEDGKFYADTRDRQVSSNQGDVTSFYVRGEVRRANKMTDKHLHRKDSFYIRERDNNHFRPFKNVLYISAYALEDFDPVGEAIAFETNRAIHYKDAVWVKLDTGDGVFGTYLTSGETFKRIETKDYGAAVEIVYNALKECGVGKDITTYEAEKLLNNAETFAKALAGAIALRDGAGEK